jgi:hypothetical protein
VIFASIVLLFCDSSWQFKNTSQNFTTYMNVVNKLGLIFVSSSECVSIDSVM